MTEFRVVDLETGAEVIVPGRSPEGVALDALGLRLVRSGSPQDLRAKIYFQSAPGQPVTMVRLYTLVADRHETSEAYK
jgi:hypothetical protein